MQFWSPKAIGALHAQCCLQGREELKLSEDTAMQLYGLKQLRIVREEKLDTKCFLAWNEDILVLAFRGTASTRNAISDLQVKPSAMLQDQDSRTGQQYTGLSLVH